MAFPVVSPHVADYGNFFIWQAAHQPKPDSDRQARVQGWALQTG
jgi:hypothetical protein